MKASRIPIAFAFAAFFVGLAMGSGIGIPIGRDFQSRAADRGDRGDRGDGNGLGEASEGGKAITLAGINRAAADGSQTSQGSQGTGARFEGASGSRQPLSGPLPGDPTGGRSGGGSSANGEPDTPSRLLAAMRIQSTQGKLDYLSQLQNLTPEEAPHLNDLIRKLGEQGYPIAEYHRLYWERWAEIDGEAAANAKFATDRRFEETLLSNLVISTWAKNDPVAASEWLSRQRDLPIRQGMIKGLLDGLAAHDPGVAQRFIQGMDLTPEHLGYGYRAIARQHSIEGGIDQVGAWYRSFSANDPSFESVARAVAQVYSRAPFNDALAWAENPGGPPEVAAVTRRGLHDQLAHRRPDGVIRHLGSDPVAESITEVTRLANLAVSRWIANDPNAMAEWLTRSSDIRNYDLVAAPFAEQIAMWDLDSARAWANTLRDPELRKTVTHRITSR